MASWQISRQPIRQGGAALLIVLAVATGTLALAQRQSWTRSDHDQAAFSSGADVRVQTSQPLSAAQAAPSSRLPGVQHAMPVATFPQPTAGTEILAIDSGQAADVALLRADQSPLAAAALFGTITPGRAAPAGGAAGPSGRGRLIARLGPRLAGAGPGHGEPSRCEDADGDVYQLDAGTLPADGRDHTLTVSLATGARPDGRRSHRTPDRGPSTRCG